MNENPPSLPTVKKKSIFLRLFRWLAIVVLLLVLASSVYRYRLNRQIDAKLAAIRAAGYPVTWEELDRWYTRPSSNDFTEFYTTALSKLVELNLPLKSLPHLDPLQLPSLGQPLTPETQTGIRTLLDTNKTVLTSLHQVRGVPSCRYQIEFTKQEAIYDSLPRFRNIGYATQLLALDAVLSAELSEPQSATDSLLSSFALDNSMRQEPDTYSRLILTCHHIFNVSAMEWCLSRKAFNDAQLLSLAAALTESADETGMTRVFAGHRARILGVFERYRSGEYPLNKSIMSGLEDAIRKRTGLLEYDMLTCLDLVNEAILAAQQPLDARPEAYKTVLRRLKAVPHVCALTHGRLLALHVDCDQDTSHLTQLRVARTALAVERYRLAQGKLPVELSDLVPAYLDAVPKDPFTGQALHYVVRNPGFTVYSVGADGKDDGGVKTDAQGVVFQPGTDITFTVVR